MAKVDVANKALSYLGEDTILSFNDDSEQARVIKTHYDLCRNTLLQGHNWNFATVRASLTAVSGHTDPVYPYAYEIPANCLKIIRTDSCEKNWRRFRDKIYSLDSTFPCEYIASDSEDYFSPLFESALVFYIASVIALTVSGDRATQQDAFKLYGQSLLGAISANDLEQGKKSLNSNDGVAMRRGLHSLSSNAIISS